MKFVQLALAVLASCVRLVESQDCKSGTTKNVMYVVSKAFSEDGTAVAYVHVEFQTCDKSSCFEMGKCPINFGHKSTIKTASIAATTQTATNEKVWPTLNGEISGISYFKNYNYVFGIYNGAYTIFRPDGRSKALQIIPTLQNIKLVPSPSGKYIVTQVKNAANAGDVYSGKGSITLTVKKSCDSALVTTFTTDATFVGSMTPQWIDDFTIRLNEYDLMFQPVSSAAPRTFIWKYGTDGKTISPIAPATGYTANAPGSTVCNAIETTSSVVARNGDQLIALKTITIINPASLWDEMATQQPLGTTYKVFIYIYIQALIRYI